MGTNKAALRFKGKRVIDQLIEVSTLYSDDVFVAGKTPNLEVTCYEDRQLNKGPLSGIQTALNKSRYNWVLILTCDLPLLDRTTMRWLSDEFKKVADNKVAYVKAANKDHYLIGFYHKEVLKEVDSALNASFLKINQLLKNNPFKTMEPPDELIKSFANINSPQDLDTFGWMKVKILTFGIVQEIIGASELQWITEGTSTTDLLVELEAKYPRLKDISFRIAKNEVIVEQETIAMDDTIALLPPFAGG